MTDGTARQRRQWQRTVVLTTVAGILLHFGRCPAAEATNTFAEVTVVAKYGGSQVGVSGTLVATLAARPGMLVKSQGGLGVQTDLSIRGSSFSGAGLSLAGISLRNPQTEHFHAELPVPPGILSSPEIVTGVDQALATDGHLVGAAGLDFPPAGEGGELGLGVGERRRNWQSLLQRFSLVSGDSPVELGMAVFAARETAESVDYRDNDLDSHSGGVHLQSLAGDLQTDLVVAGRRKEFGARGYYGVNPAWSADETIEDTLVLATCRAGTSQEEYARLSAAWRRIEDHYRLYPTHADVYENRHRSGVLSCAGDGKRTFVARTELNWRLGAEQERLESSGLGDHRRRRGYLLLLPGWRSGRLKFLAGARGEVFTDDTPAILPQAGVDARLSECDTLYCSYSETARQPSFTELNYESPGSLGNAGLERQESQSAEIGWRRQRHSTRKWRLAGFHRRTANTVDWVKQDAEATRWVATDLGNVRTLGIEAGIDYAATDDLVVRAGYEWLHKEHDAGTYAGRYVLDYPEQSVRLAVVWRVSDTWQLVGTQAVRRQTSNPVRTSDRLSLDGRVALEMTPGTLRGARVSLMLENVWDDDFEVYAGQAVPGRRLSAGLTLDW